MTSTAAKTGTVKIGRWTYPVRETADGTERNTKRDSSGEWTPIEEARFDDVVWDAPAVELYTELSPQQKAVLAQIGNSQGQRVGESFDFFDDGIVEGSGIWLVHASDQTSNPPAARRAFKSLGNMGYVEIGEVEKHSDTPADRWMSLTAKGAKAALAFRGQSTDLPEFKAGHASGGGNQTKRPGKSDWKVGSKCPQGHTLTVETLYTMPSGRNQCRECRNTMPSRTKSA